MAEQWLSIVEYARTYNISDMTVRRRIKTGKLHAVLKDGKYFIPTPIGSEARALTPAENVKGKTGGMTIIKGHPAAEKTYATAIEERAATTQYKPVTRTPAADEGRADEVPSALTSTLEGKSTSLVDTKALIAFCNASLKRLAETERRVGTKFRYKAEALEAQIREKELEIGQLSQQVEDLQLLVKVLERKKTT